MLLVSLVEFFSRESPYLYQFVLLVAMFTMAGQSELLGDKLLCLLAVERILKAIKLMILIFHAHDDPSNLLSLGRVVAAGQVKASSDPACVLESLLLFLLIAAPSGCFLSLGRSTIYGISKLETHCLRHFARVFLLAVQSDCSS